MKISRFLGALLVLFSLIVQADVSLPIHTLRDQGTSDHCWAYSMSHLLEARALARESTEILIHTEKDIKYWVDYERMMYNFRSKNSFYLGNYEGGWQIEYFESLLKHGKNVLANSVTNPVVPYEKLKNYFQSLPYNPVARPRPDLTLPDWEVAGSAMKSAPSELEAHNYAIDYLNRKYGAPAEETVWSGQSIATSLSGQLILGTDFENNNSLDAVVLVKPVTDGQYGWVKYLENRYWGYRYDQKQILSLIEKSLDNKWPVTFDNVQHAMTILAYTEDAKGAHFYAVADSIPGKITWYDSGSLLYSLNLVTFFKSAIKGALPERTSSSLLRLLLPLDKSIDQFDHLTFPPR